MTITQYMDVCVVAWGSIDCVTVAKYMGSCVFAQSSIEPVSLENGMVIGACLRGIVQHEITTGCHSMYSGIPGDSASVAAVYNISISIPCWNSGDV